MIQNPILRVTEHRRDSAGLTYVYPVRSRRAGGISVGINLNVNKACNWACIYCQVEGLTRGGPDPVDLVLLEKELYEFLKQALNTVSDQEANQDCLMDIAFSGDGEPTSAPEFHHAATIVCKVLENFQLIGKLPVRLITNGSLIHRPEVQQGLATLALAGGEAWFKLDRATPEETLAINGTQTSTIQTLRNLHTCASIIPTWIQTCWFALDGKQPDQQTKQAYLEIIAKVTGEIRGIHLYGIARPSMQPGKERLRSISPREIQEWATEIERETGTRVTVSP